MGEVSHSEQGLQARFQATSGDTPAADRNSFFRLAFFANQMLSI